MTREKIRELDLILDELESTIKAMQEYKEWLSVHQFAQLIGVSDSLIYQYVDREAFLPYRRNAIPPERGIKIKNCPEAIQLMRCYKYRNFEYERELLRNKIHDSARY